MNAFRHGLSKYLLIWLVLVCVLAFFWNKIFGSSGEILNPFLISNSLMQGLIAVTMLAIGSLLPVEEIKKVGRRWPTVLGGTCVQYISMPLLAFLVSKLFHLEGPYFLGVMMAGCVPGAMASNMLTMLARGNVSYSVCLTTSSTLFSPIVVPWTLYYFLKKDVPLDAMAISENLLITVVFPVIIGFTLARLFSWWRQGAAFIAEIIANIAIIWIIAATVARNQELFYQIQPMLFVALILLNLCGFAAGYLGGSLMRIDGRMCRALILEIGMQNAGLGTYLATTYFPDSKGAALCCAMYTFGCMFNGIILAQILRNFFSSDEETGDVEDKSHIR